MTTATVSAPGTGAVQSTNAMRAEADQLNASVRDDNRSLHERAAGAAQLAWEADLIDGARSASPNWKAQSPASPPWWRRGTRPSQRSGAAEDRLRADERHLARRRAEERKAEDGLTCLPSGRRNSASASARPSASWRPGQAVVAVVGAVREVAQGRLDEWRQPTLPGWTAHTPKRT